jgi:hypothetical protein
MRIRTQLIAVAVTVAAWVALGGSAMAVFPNTSDCPTSNPSVIGCVDIQNTSGNLNIKGFNVPLGPSLEIRGGFNMELGFVPPRGTNGFFSRPVEVPGGLLGIEWIPGTTVLAITELAGPSSSIRIGFQPPRPSITVPIKVRLENLLLGMNCHIGSDSSPVMLHLVTEATNPPPPNRPIEGRYGSVRVIGGTITISENINVDNAFAVPASSTCGLGLGLINAIVNARLQLPSAAGNNSMEVHSNIGIINPYFRG